MSHPTALDAYDGTLKELAHDVANLRYDALQEFLDALRHQLVSDGGKDFKRGRRRLAEDLRLAAGAVAGASISIGDAWTICKDHVE